MLEIPTPQNKNANKNPTVVNVNVFTLTNVQSLLDCLAKYSVYTVQQI